MSLRLFQWKPIPCRFWLNRCKGSLRLRTQRAFASVFFSASLLLCSFPLAADATQEQDIATIASILSNWNQAGYVASTPYTFPFGMTIAEYFMYSFGWAPDYNTPADQSLKGLLQQILQKPSSAWSTNDVLAVLSALNGISSNLVSSSSGGFDSNFWTNALVNPNTRAPFLSDIEYNTSYGLLDQNSGNSFLLPQYEFFREAMGSSASSSGDSLLPSEFADFFDLMTQYDRVLRVDPAGGADALATYSFLHGVSETALSQLDVTFSGALNVQLNQAVEYLVSQLASQLDDISGNPHVIGPLNESTNLLAKIHYNDLGYEGSGRSVADDFFFLFQQLGVEHPDPTNNIAAILRRFFAPEEEEELVRLTNSVLDEQLRAKREEVDAAEVVVTNQVSNVATNSPDFEAHQYSESNPIDTGDNIFNLPRNQFNLVTPSLPDSSDRTIVLFQGGFPIYGGNGGGTRSASRSVRLDISYPLADHDAVSNGVSMMRSIMEWVWQWVFLILSVRMLFAFYASLTESRNLMNSGVGGLTLN